MFVFLKLGCCSILVTFDTDMSLPRGAVEIIVVSFVFLFLAVIALIFRLLSRRIQRIKLCFNDYAIILAMVGVLDQTIGIFPSY